MRILLVEDHADAAAMLARLLRAGGHDVTRAASVAAAKLLCASHEFDVMVSDVLLPDGDGWQLMRHLRESAGLPGVALTACAFGGDEGKSPQAGFLAHLNKNKPPDLKRLLWAIDEAVHKRVNLEVALAPAALQQVH